ncbi:Methyl-accepting chemotaxis protein [Salinisphaera hydrothermalis C27AD]
MIDGLEGSLKWLEEVTKQMSTNSHTIAYVNDRLSRLKIDVSGIADFTRERAQELDRYIENIQSRLSDHDSRIQRLDLRVRAKENLDFVIDHWAAGNFCRLSPLARCYAALEELRWGAFGDFMRNAPAGEQCEWRQNLVHKLAAQLARDVDKAVKKRLIFRDYWLSEPAADDSALALKNAVRYLGDWSGPRGSPFVYMASQTPGDMPRGIPRISAADRVAIGLINDVFDGCAG